MSAPSALPALDRAAHVAFLTRVLDTPLPASHAGYEASRVWLTYWALAGLDLLGALDGPALGGARRAAARFVLSCQSPHGGFGGGPGQAPHALSTFAALAALTIVAAEGALGAVDTDALLGFFARLRDDTTGAFRVTEDGEPDVRAAYGVVAAATLAGVARDAAARGLFARTADFLTSAVSHEGAPAGEPGGEAHGGYAYCALAAGELLRRAGAGAAAAPDAASGVRGLALRQTREGGFAGRANKLVDACYSFWQAGALAVIGGARARAALDADALVAYVLGSAQAPGGGLRDKPGKPPDAYHTCYALGGLALAQHWGGAATRDADRVHTTSALFNVREERLREGEDACAARDRERARRRG
jgi:protein farnesyltransferase subunit beta